MKASLALLAIVARYHTNTNNKSQTEQTNRIEIEICSLALPTEFVDCWEVLVQLTCPDFVMVDIRNLSSDFVMVQAID